MTIFCIFLWKALITWFKPYESLIKTIAELKAWLLTSLATIPNYIKNEINKIPTSIKVLKTDENLEKGWDFKTLQILSLTSNAGKDLGWTGGDDFIAIPLASYSRKYALW